MTTTPEGREGRVVITQEDISRMVSELEFLESLASNFRQNIALINASMNELRNAREFIKLMNSIDIVDSYVTIGGGIFIKSKPTDISRVLLTVGAGYVIEAESNKAVDYVNNKMKELEEIKSKAEVQLSETIRRAEDIRRFLTYVYASIRRQQQQR